ncbi:DMT family transporter [Woodsholea maritima]|uniref:DMT family transporter n=1 Tax=Woodsholea maritima TaxID=240237 RepID=UPI0003766875|nr:EamA family transporter [Woodsholea maritima]
MGRDKFWAIVVTLIAPSIWGSSYIIFTQTLPIDHPLLVAALRALPAGIILMLLGPGLPPRDKLIALMTLGVLNIGLFFGLLFFAASRLPGGLAATLSATQPLIVAFLAWPLLGKAPQPIQIGAGVAGLIGVGLLILDPTAQLDALGMLAALAGAGAMAVGTVLISRWGKLGSPMGVAAWQLTFGGILLLPLALVVEGMAPVPTALNWVGLSYLVLVGTAFAYWIFIRGIGKLGPDAAFLGFFSPLTATLLGAIFLGEWFNGWQWLGIALILAATFVGVAVGRGKSAAPQDLPRGVGGTTSTPHERHNL